MIGVAGQYIVEFQIGEFTDFINEQDLIIFKLIEEAGNVLPQFELRFNLMNNNVLRCLNEGQVLKVAFGRNFTDMMNIELVPIKKTIIQTSTYYIVNLIGVLDCLPYLMDTKISISEETSGIEQIISVVGDNGMLVDTNIDESLDSQKWIQPNISDHNFVNQIWLHSKLDNSFPMVGITSNGVFKIRSLKEMLVDGSYDWLFSYGAVSSEDAGKNIVYNYDAIVESETGFTNMWSGYDRTKTVYNLTTGETSTIEADLNTSFITRTLDRSSSVGDRIVEAGALNTNVDIDYWKTYLNNLSNLVRFSSTVIKLTFDHFFVPIKVLDIALFRTPELGSLSQIAVDIYSGLYVISKVARTITHRKLTTHITMSREAFDNLNGDLQ